MSTTRPQQRCCSPDIRPYTVKASNTVRQGFPVKLDSGYIVEAAAIGDNVIGIAYKLQQRVEGVSTVPAWPAAAGQKVMVWHLGAGVCPALVGTGGATAGAPAKFVSDGATDATVGGGTNKLCVLGQWEEAGAAGELAGLNLAMAGFAVGS